MRGRPGEHAEPAALRRRPLAPGRRLQVRAGGEVAAGAGDHPDEQVVLGVEPVHRRLHRLGAGAVEGVARLGPVDGDDQHVAAALGEDPLLSLMAGSQRQGEAAVHRIDLTGDPAGGVGGEEQHHVGDVRRLGRAGG